MSKDLSTKMLIQNNDVFSDIINVLVYNGKQIVKEDELVDKDSNGFYFSSSTIKGLQRDVCKLWEKENINLSCLSIENQTKTDKDMPLRMIGYDGATYRNELKEKNRYPCLSLVLYFGYKHWKTSKSLYDCFKVDESMKPFINDYKINLIEISYLSEEQIDLFQSDFKVIAQYFVQKRKYKDYKPSNQILKHVKETIQLLSAFSKDERIIEIYNESEEKEPGGITNMCEVIDKIENRGVNKGISQERKNVILSLKDIFSPEQIANQFTYDLSFVLSVLNEK